MPLPAESERELEAHTVALNRWLYADGVGLDVEPDGYAAPAQALAALYERLRDAPDPVLRACALENWSEARRLSLDNAITAALDEHGQAPEYAGSEGPLTWRNWKAFERETQSAQVLAEAYARLIAAAEPVTPLLEQRLAALRADFASQATTPVHTFCAREALTPERLRVLLVDAGTQARPAFAAALDVVSQAVWGRAAGPAEFHALYLNRMYEPTDRLFAEAAAAPEQVVARAQAHFRQSGFDLSAVPVDLANRPRKYPGAFCFPVAIPGDVRVSVRVATPHHLVDMLYHELGHAAHFAGIDPALPFVDRYWIHAGTHETFSTLFEYLLAEPAFLAEELGLPPAGVAALLAFARFKQLLTAAWSSAQALTALETWLEALSWPAVEQRFAAWAERFTGLALPTGYARLDPFVNAASIYPAGYVLAEARVGGWRPKLKALGGEAWWRSPAAQADIRARLWAGGRAGLAEHCGV